MERYYEINDGLAKTANDANSMFAFKSDAEEYRSNVDEAYARAEQAAERCPERAEEAVNLAGSNALEWHRRSEQGFRVTPLSR